MRQCENVNHSIYGSIESGFKVSYIRKIIDWRGLGRGTYISYQKLQETFSLISGLAEASLSLDILTEC